MTDPVVFIFSEGVLDVLRIVIALLLLAGSILLIMNGLKSRRILKEADEIKEKLKGGEKH
ncbi:hypothetical protein [Halobacillus litoralis]|uniref:Uncharacterized protein n=1 Tax=Halobacillus litoralis TaxID=45668 RepID=A0A410MCJ3_9BACI|nr:hypothetical protein [Halobacillus litoralis]QAS52385.1 hypothetical protein HLI_09140 [Halobacillus litoralis]